MKLNMFIAIFLVISSSCTHFETEELNNQYLYVKSTTYKNGNSSGFNNGNITDLHVNVDGTTTSFLRIPQTMIYSIENETSSVFFFPLCSPLKNDNL